MDIQPPKMILGMTCERLITTHTIHIVPRPVVIDHVREIQTTSLFKFITYIITPIFIYKMAATAAQQYFLWLHSRVWKPTCQLHTLPHDHMILWWGIVVSPLPRLLRERVLWGLSVILSPNELLANSADTYQIHVSEWLCYIIHGNELVSPTVLWTSDKGSR